MRAWIYMLCTYTQVGVYFIKNWIWIYYPTSNFIYTYNILYTRPMLQGVRWYFNKKCHPDSNTRHFCNFPNIRHKYFPSRTTLGACNYFSCLPAIIFLKLKEPKWCLSHATMFCQNYLYHKPNVSLNSYWTGKQLLLTKKHFKCLISLSGSSNQAMFSQCNVKS